MGFGFDGGCDFNRCDIIDEIITEKKKEKTIEEKSITIQSYYNS
jgi:hypothetical protein